MFNIILCLGKNVDDYAKHFNSFHRTDDYKHACTDCSFKCTNRNPHSSSKISEIFFGGGEFYVAYLTKCFPYFPQQID